MQTGNILQSLDIIESTIRTYKQDEIETSHRIIKDEIFNIQHSTNDTIVIELIFRMYYDWKVYSGQLGNNGFTSGRQIELESIFNDCSNIRAHITRFRT